MSAQEEALSNYGKEEIATLANFYGYPFLAKLLGGIYVFLLMAIITGGVAGCLIFVIPTVVSICLNAGFAKALLVLLICLILLFMSSPNNSSDSVGKFLVRCFILAGKLDFRVSLLN